MLNRIIRKIVPKNHKALLQKKLEELEKYEELENIRKELKSVIISDKLKYCMEDTITTSEDSDIDCDFDDIKPIKKRLF